MNTSSATFSTRDMQGRVWLPSRDSYWSSDCYVNRRLIFSVWTSLDVRGFPSRSLTVRSSNESKDQGRSTDNRHAVGRLLCVKCMGAAGFEPATAWSEAKYSVQTELSALTSSFPVVPYKSLDFYPFRQRTTHSRAHKRTPLVSSTRSRSMKISFGDRYRWEQTRTHSGERDPASDENSPVTKRSSCVPTTNGSGWRSSRHSRRRDRRGTGERAALDRRRRPP